MIVSQFQAWARTAPAPSRADGVSALARALLYSRLTPEQSRATVGALTAFLDDPSPLVRRAMAEAFAGAGDAPHHIVCALAEDQPSIAAVVLGRSPLFTNAELIDFVESGSAAAQRAIAGRASLAAPVSEALAEIGDADALVALASNFGADLPASTLRRMVARHGADADVREALLARGHLPPAIRVDLMAATAGALARLVTQRDWMSGERAKRITREASERATLAIAASDPMSATELEDLTATLRASGQLSVAFALRALLSGHRALFCAILGDLAGSTPERVDGLLRHSECAGFAALYRRAGLPLALLPVFRLVLHAGTGTEAAPSGAGLSPALVKVALRATIAANDRSLDRLAVLLRRFEIEAERDAARAAAPAPTERVWPAQPQQAAAAFAGASPPLALVAETLPPAVTFDEAVSTQRAVPMARPQPARFTIDLAAIEAELLAA